MYGYSSDQSATGHTRILCYTALELLKSAVFSEIRLYYVRVYCNAKSIRGSSRINI